jgi:alpha-methylacyl-CoA racemase
MLLADLGAEVVAVEPLDGEPGRHMPNRVGKDSALHWWVGRNKSAIFVDLKSEEGLAAFRHEVATADIIIEGFRPGVAARLGVDYESCRAIREDIIYCSVSSFGQLSDRRGVPAHDLNYAAKAGMLGLTVDADGRPVLVGFPVTDVAGGLHAAVGILAALHHRERTGQGQYLDVSIVAASVGLTGMQLMKALSGQVPTPASDMNLGGDPAYGLYACEDGGFVAIACVEDKFWRRLCEVIEAPDIVDRRFVEPDAVSGRLADIFATRSRAAWCELLEDDTSVCFSPVLGIGEVADDEDVRISGMIGEMEGEDGITYPQIGTPIRMSLTPPSLRTPAPGLPETVAGPR